MNRPDRAGVRCDALLEGYALLGILKDGDGEPYDYEILDTNPQFEAITGLAHALAVGNTLRRALPALDKVWDQFSACMPRSDKIVRFEFYFENFDKHFLVSSFNPSEDRAVLLFTEITLQKKAVDALRVYEVLFENAQDIMLYLRPDGQIVNANKRACEQYGYTKEQLLSMKIQNLRHPSTASEYERQMQKADREGIVFESVHVRSDGSFFPVEVSAKTTYTARESLRVHIIRDITQRKENEKKIAWLAGHDMLTGIPNRVSFLARLEEEIARALRNKSSFAVMLFDIDRFKNVNDHYGHEAGDLLLRYVAERAQATLRATDQIARLGGDEFVVLQPGVALREDSVALAERIFSALQEGVLYRGSRLHAKLSVGISLFPEDAPDANGLLHCADHAMYEIKRSGGGGYGFFSPHDPLRAQKDLDSARGIDPP